MLFENLFPNGRLGLGEITVTKLFSDKASAISYDNFAETTGSGGKTQLIINILSILILITLLVKKEILFFIHEHELSIIL